MRGRGHYRRPTRVATSHTVNTTNTSIRFAVKPDPDIEVIDLMDVDSHVINKEPHFNGKPYDQMKTSAKPVVDIITIDSDEDIDEDIDIDIDDDIHVIDSDYESAATTSSVSSIDEKPQICCQCKDRVVTRSGEDWSQCKYNELTSADFYINPRIHSSVISLELKDKNRLKCFNETIMENKDLFRGKTVLIIGSFYGLLGLFAAKVMAKHVIICDGIGIWQIIESVIDKNRRKFGHKNCTQFYVMRENLSQMVLPDGIQKVDIIVSDWVNHSLFYKSLFHHFIKARDNWLRKDGHIFPDSADLYLVAAHDYIHKHDLKSKRYSKSTFVKRVDYWTEKVYDCDMTALRQRVLSEPFHDTINYKQIITDDCHLKHFNFYQTTLNDLKFESPFKLLVQRDHYLQSFALLFNVIFKTGRTFPHMLSTRPDADRNLFRPTVFYLDSDKQLTVYKDDRLNGDFKFGINSDLNEMSVDIGFKFKNKVCDKPYEQMSYKTCPSDVF